MMEHNQTLVVKGARVEEVVTDIRKDLALIRRRSDWTSNKLLEAIGHIQALTHALDTAFISTWQSTHAWQKELDAAKRFINNE